MLNDIDIARSVAPRPIGDVAARLDIPPEALSPYGRHMAKVDGAWLKAQPPRPDAALILVTAVSPTPAGEGKTTTTIGLGDALNRIGKRTAICIREPSLGPCFGQKGGATGGGRAQVIPMETINLHFTGDFHAIGAANNLLAAMLDNHIYWGNALGIDPARVVWRRAMDMNDRSLRHIVTALGREGMTAETGFDITVASEVMAVFCLATDLADLRARLGRIVVAERADGSLITCADLTADGAMTALLKDAFSPNIVQTLEGNPTLIHGGPFGNIAHGCNSVVATAGALKLADYVVTEAGFGADLGAEKFFDIKCRQAGLMPQAAVIVATIRSLKMNGGLAKSALARPDLAALERGCANLGRHVENVRGFGVPPIVAINHFTQDAPEEVAQVRAYGEALGVEVVLCRHWGEGGAGAEDLARRVVALVEGRTARFAPLYADDLGLMDKIRAVATGVYRAASVSAEPGVAEALARWEARGFGHLPVCIAKTQYSFTTDPKLLGAPQDHDIRIKRVRLSAGAGFVVALAGDIMTMPGLPRVPAAEGIGVDEAGEIYGLF